MKYILLILVILLSSCSINDYYWEIPEDIQTIEQVEDLMQSFEYVRTSNWRLPDNTYSDRSGGCTSLSGLLAYIMEYRLGYNDVKLVIGESKNGVGHMFVCADGLYYEGQTGELVYNEYYIKSTISVEKYIRLTRYR